MEKSIGLMIKEALDKRGMTEAQLAKLTGMAKKTILKCIHDEDYYIEDDRLLKIFFAIMPAPEMTLKRACEIIKSFDRFISDNFNAPLNHLYFRYLKEDESITVNSYLSGFTDEKIFTMEFFPEAFLFKPCFSMGKRYFNSKNVFDKYTNFPLLDVFFAYRFIFDKFPFIKDKLSQLYGFEKFVEYKANPPSNELSFDELSFDTKRVFEFLYEQYCLGAKRKNEEMLPFDKSKCSVSYLDAIGYHGLNFFSFCYGNAHKDYVELQFWDNGEYEYAEISGTYYAMEDNPTINYTKYSIFLFLNDRYNLDDKIFDFLRSLKIRSWSILYFAKLLVKYFPEENSKLRKDSPFVEEFNEIGYDKFLKMAYETILKEYVLC